VSLLQVFKPLFIIPVLRMANSAQCHKVFDAVGKLTATHSTGFDVMNVHGFTSTAFTRDKIGLVIAEVFKIYGRVLLHSQSFVDYF
jgi:hypothetical protein